MSLGLTGSGKTNYIAAALVYMATCCNRSERLGKWNFSRFKDWSITQNNGDISELIDRFENDHLKKGRWYDKTQPGEKNVFDFDVPCRFSLFPPRLDFAKSVSIKDWSGETFSSLIDCDPDVGEDSLETFREDCRNAEGFILCLDGKSLLDEKRKREVQDSLRKFGELVGWLKPKKGSGQESNSNNNSGVSTRPDIRRNFAIIVTKADLLIGLDDFCRQDSDLLNLDVLNRKIRQSYRSFFGILQRQNCGIGVFPVSLIPSGEMRKNDPAHGRMPDGRNWDLDEVMESSLIDEASREDVSELYFGNMYGAFLWLLEIV